jgi:hypothetical protein
MTKLEYEFYAIPKQLLSDCKGNENAYFLYSLLLSRTNTTIHNGERVCWPTIEQLQSDTDGWGRSKINDAINFLCETGWIGNIENMRQTGSKWGNNKYYINVIPEINY